MQHHIRSASSTLAIALAAAFGIAPDTTQAAFVVVTADPLFTTTYIGQGWSAQGALYIPDNCYGDIQNNNGTGYYQLNLGDGGCNGLSSGVQLQDVKVNLYNGTPSNIFETISLDPYTAESYLDAYGGHNTLSRLIDVDFFDGQVVGLHTTLSTSVTAGTPLSGDDVTELQLQFSKDFTPPIYGEGRPQAQALALATSDANSGSPIDCSSAVAGNGAILCVTGTRNGVKTVTGSQADSVTISEPGTGALGVAALVAAALARRRGRAARS